MSSTAPVSEIPRRATTVTHPLLLFGIPFTLSSQPHESRWLTCGVTQTFISEGVENLIIILFKMVAFVHPWLQ